MTRAKTRPCCGERYEPARDEMGVICACEWDGCDEDCPHVQSAARAVRDLLEKEDR